MRVSNQHWIAARSNRTHAEFEVRAIQARKNLIFVTDIRLQSKVTWVTVSTILALVSDQHPQ